MWKSNVSFTFDKTKRIIKMQYEHQSERFHRIRYAYPQLRVTNLASHQGPTGGHGAHRTHIYKVDDASKLTV